MPLRALLPFATPVPVNAPRFQLSQGGHVESWFVRANHPSRPLALWLKATVLRRLDGSAVAERWFIWFDGERGTSFGHRDTVALDQASFESRPDGQTWASVAGSEFRFGGLGAALGGGHGKQGDFSFDVQFEPARAPLAGPMSIYRNALMVEGPFPRSKTLTPAPWLVFRGRVSVAGQEVSLDGWQGMQGHNWGKEHYYEYAWGVCLFPGRDGEPPALFEGGTARIKLGGRVTPRMSSLVVRRGDAEYRFDNFLDVRHQEPTLGPRRWTLRVSSPDGEARLRMDMGTQPLACLGYENPDGHLTYCFNSKLAAVQLEVHPRSGRSFACHSPHGGALEFLRHEAEPGLEVI